MKKLLINTTLAFVIGCSLTLMGCSVTKNVASRNINVSEKENFFTNKEAEKVIDGIYKALINKNSSDYIKYINSESLKHLNSSEEEIKKTIDDYLLNNKVKEYKILSTEDFNENTKIINTKYVEISKDGHSSEHEDMLFLQKNLDNNKIEIIYNGAVSSQSFALAEVLPGEFKIQLDKTITLFDGIGASLYIENKTNSKISIGYGSIFGSVILTTEDGETYNLPFNEVKLYEPNSKDRISSFTYETTGKISKVEIQGVFELNENSAPKEGSPKSFIVYEK